MEDISIIIPSRLASVRLPNKPLKKIKDLEMVLHVNELARKANIGKVIVATPDEKIAELVRGYGGNAVKTEKNHETGTDRIYEVFDKVLNRQSKIIINLQGDMPNLEISSLKFLANHMKKNFCDIGTLASELDDEEKINENVVKVQTEKKIFENSFSKASDFFRHNPVDKKNIYHHIGIYAFTSESLTKFVEFDRSKLEIERRLEQLRALENNMKIDVGFIKSPPLSVDTEEDLSKVKNIMENK